MFIDILLLLPVFISALVLKIFRRVGAHRLPLLRKTLIYVGVFPIRDHYYEPLFNPKHLKHSLDLERFLPGISWNIDDQISLLKRFNYENDILSIDNFDVNNGSFGPGDIEIWYSIIRYFKPSRIIEIGSGYSTIVATNAIIDNKKDDKNYVCDHLCIEPYEMEWLESFGVKVLRQVVEDVDLSIFKELNNGDILFIDSSHIIRPQGDVLREFLQILPLLNKGVIVHIHDIFTPRDYSKNAILNHVSFWNEQYLLEAFLSQNDQWEIITMVNHLKHSNYEILKNACPYLENINEPGSFYIRKR
jgi:hypothetical protein